MADLEMLYVKNGEGNNPLFQIGTRNEDGSYNIMYTDYLKEHQAIAFLEKLKSQEEPVVEKAIEEMVLDNTLAEEPSNIPDYKGMSKKKLEETMRSYGIELDRRKSRAALLEEVEMFFDGKLT
tara:strand:- start:428 stop:796 length:369 start_codon:yes stop_codon:yes gene_type:complete